MNDHSELVQQCREQADVCASRRTAKILRAAADALVAEDQQVEEARRAFAACADDRRRVIAELADRDQRIDHLSDRLTAAESQLSVRTALRRELEILLGVPHEAASDEQFERGVAAVRALRERIAALEQETCDLTGRLDLARQERGIAEADRDQWERTATNLLTRAEKAEQERDGMRESRNWNARRLDSLAAWFRTVHNKLPNDVVVQFWNIVANNKARPEDVQSPAEARTERLWNIVRDRHADEAKWLVECHAISLTSCQCGYLQRMWALAESKAEA